MFAYKERIDSKFGETVRDYVLTQGDSFTLYAEPDNPDDIELIEQISFKLYDVGNNDIIVYEQPYALQDNKYYCNVPAEATAKWSTDADYRYEVEVKFVDNVNVTTLTQAKWKVMAQGVIGNLVAQGVKGVSMSAKMKTVGRVEY